MCGVVSGNSQHNHLRYWLQGISMTDYLEWMNWEGKNCPLLESSFLICESTLYKWRKGTEFQHACSHCSFSSQGRDVASCFKFSELLNIEQGTQWEKKSKNREQNNTRTLSLWNCVVRVYYHGSRRRNQEKKLRRNERKHALVRNTLFFIFL